MPTFLTVWILVSDQPSACISTQKLTPYCNSHLNMAGQRNVLLIGNPNLYLSQQNIIKGKASLGNEFTNRWILPYEQLLTYCDVTDTWTSHYLLWHHQDRLFPRGLYGRFLFTMALMPMGVNETAKYMYVMLSFPSFIIEKICRAVDCLVSDVISNWTRIMALISSGGQRENYTLN